MIHGSNTCCETFEKHNLLPNFCACPVECAAYSSGVGLRQYLAFFKGFAVSYERPTNNAAAFAFLQYQKKYAPAAKSRLQTQSGRITSYSLQWQAENLKSSRGQRGI